MKFLISFLVVSIFFSTHASALGKREEGVLIGIGSALLVGSVMRDRDYGGGDYGYGRYGNRDEFPPFRCRSNSVQCAYERGVWEREREIWLQEKDQAYRCGRYGECDDL